MAQQTTFSLPPTSSPDHSVELQAIHVESHPSAPPPPDAMDESDEPTRGVKKTPSLRRGAAGYHQLLQAAVTASIESKGRLSPPAPPGMVQKSEPALNDEFPSSSPQNKRHRQSDASNRSLSQELARNRRRRTEEEIDK